MPLHLRAGLCGPLASKTAEALACLPPAGTRWPRMSLSYPPMMFNHWSKARYIFAKPRTSEQAPRSSGAAPRAAPSPAASPRPAATATSGTVEPVPAAALWCGGLRGAPAPRGAARNGRRSAPPLPTHQQPGSGRPLRHAPGAAPAAAARPARASAAQRQPWSTGAAALTAIG